MTISTVEKVYSTTDPVDFVYKVTYSDSSYVHVPNTADNRHYQDIQEWIADGNTITDNGAD